MKRFILPALLALAACMPPVAQQHRQQQTSAASPASGDAASKPGASEAAIPAAPAIDRQVMIGRWGDNGDCTKDIVLNADGSFTSYTGGEGRWSLRGDVLRLEGKGGTFDLQLALLDRNRLRITNPDGSVGTSQRCE